MVDSNLLSVRDKITHGAAKVVIPLAIHHAWLMFHLDKCGVSEASDLRDSNYKMYKDHYYKIIRAVLDDGSNFGGFAPNSTMREAVDVAFTLLDSDGGYEMLIKKFYEAEEKHFWKKFVAENFQIKHE